MNELINEFHQLIINGNDRHSPRRTNSRPGWTTTKDWAGWAPVFQSALYGRLLVFDDWTASPTLLLVFSARQHKLDGQRQRKYFYSWSIANACPFLYALEVCPLNKADLRSLDFTVNRVLMKLFRTSNIEIVQDCRVFFKFKLPSEILILRYNKFISNLHESTRLHN